MVRLGGNVGDHRADIKIRFEIHGKVYEHEFWINYWPDETGIDVRVQDFFRASWEDALLVYADLIAEADQREQERIERAEYARLQSKFGVTL